MSIRFKIILLLIAISVVLCATIYGVGSTVLMDNYYKIENESMVRNLERVSDALTNEIAQLDTKLTDWAKWDDSYKFVDDKNKEYIKSNLTDGSMENLKLKGMFFYDKKGKLAYAKIYQDDSAALKNIKKYISLHPELAFFKNQDTHKSGLISTDGGVFIIASQPILTSNGEGPIKGSLVFIKSFGDADIKQLGSLTHLAIKTYSYDATEQDLAEARKKISSKEKYYLKANSDKIDGIFLFYDVNGSPVLFAEIESDRTIVAQGKRTMFTFMAVTASTVFVFGMIMFFFMEELVLKRLTGLSREARDIGSVADLSKRVRVSGKDEIAKLAQSINAMLQNLKNSEDAKNEVLAKNEEISRTLKERYDEIEKTNSLMVGRELKMIELKSKIKELTEEKPKDK